MAIADLFDATSVPATAKAPDSGLLVTNHLNVMYMLAAGLVMPPAGFGDKYYHDTLGDVPGWIPPFIDKVPKEAIESSTSEAGHLKPSIVEVSLAGLSGRVMAIGDDGLREIHFPDQLEGDRTCAPGARAAAHVPDRVDRISVGGRQTGLRSGCEGIRQRAVGNLQAQDEQGAVH